MELTELRRRLAGRVPVEPVVPVLADDTRRLLERLEAIHRRSAEPARGPALADRLGGVEAAPGLVQVIRRYPLSLRHGRLALAELTRLEYDRHGALRWTRRLTPDRLVFLDTETTGLAGGAGSLAFLVGVARLAADALELTQWLLTAFAGEAAMLHRLSAALAPEDVLVSFNGKAFDLPCWKPGPGCWDCGKGCGNAPTSTCCTPCAAPMAAACPTAGCKPLRPGYWASSVSMTCPAPSPPRPGAPGSPAARWAA